MTTLIVQFKKIESDDEIKYSTFYLNSMIEYFFNESDTDDKFKAIYIIDSAKVSCNVFESDYWFSHRSYY